MTQFFTSGGLSIGVSAQHQVLPVIIQDWFPLGWTGWISLQSKGLSSPKPRFKWSILQCSTFFMVQLLHPYTTTVKTIALTRWAFVDKVMSLLFNMLSRLVITFLSRSKCLLISSCSHHLQWFWRPSQKNKDVDALYSQQKWDLDLTMPQIINSLLPNSRVHWRN